MVSFLMLNMFRDFRKFWLKEESPQSVGDGHASLIRRILFS